MSLAGGLNKLVHRLVALDYSLSARLTLTEEARLRRTIAVLGAHLGDGIVWCVIAAIALWLGNEAIRRSVLLAAVAVAIAGGLTTGLKFLTRRGRPREINGFYSTRYDRYSFPSGHATRVACLAMVCSHQGPVWAAGFYALALFIALCRVVLGIHYIFDVLTGLAVGSLVSWGVVRVWQ